MRVLSILLRYGTAKYSDAEERNDDIFRRALSEVEHETLVVDNALPDEFVERGQRRTVIAGDNSFREFSGWDRGIEFLGAEIWKYDLIHLVTSAFNMLYTAYLARFSTPLLRAIQKRPVCLGHIDCYNTPVQYGPYSSQHWLRTSFLFLAPSEIRALGGLVTVRDSSRLFSVDPCHPFREDAPLSPQYREYVLRWLLGHDIGQGVTWHSRFSLGVSTFALFQQKAVAILNEHLFSIRLRACGCRLVDATWLATMLPSTPPERIPWDKPWREQLAERAWDAVRLPEPAGTEGICSSGQEAGSPGVRLGSAGEDAFRSAFRSSQASRTAPDLS